VYVARVMSAARKDQIHLLFPNEYIIQPFCPVLSFLALTSTGNVLSTPSVYPGEP
jgi:hypothetical protein